MKEPTRLYTQQNFETVCINTKPGNYPHKYTSTHSKSDAESCIIENNNLNDYQNTNMYFWNFGTINIRTGNEKDEGYKLYSIANEVAKANLSFCCLQEVRYRNHGKKVITLTTGESFAFFWCGQKKRRNAGVGILIKQCKDITFDEPDVLDPRIMALNMKIKGFNIRVVNGYSHTNCGDGLDNQKDIFYRSLRKACIKQQKHQKILVCGDFNATTAVSLKQSYFNGQITEDPICNDNGLRLKRFIRESGFCMTQTYFNHLEEERFTWFSGDKTTKKVLDYVIAEPFIQQYVKDCAVYSKLNFDSDHRIIITSMLTPTTKKARWKPRSPKLTTKIDLKALKENKEIKISFINAVTHEFTNFGQHVSTANQPEQISSNIITLLKTAAESTLPKLSEKKAKEIWKDDNILNELLKQRKDAPKDCDQYKILTKEIKKRVNHLKNEKLAKEADELNEYANKKQIEDLYRNFKSDNSSFNRYKPKSGRCDPALMKAYFKKHFTAETIDNEPIELIDAPTFLQLLQSISTEDIKVGPPDEREILYIIKKLKDGKSTNDIPSTFIKNAIGCADFKAELLKLYETIWETLRIPKDWGHSKLITLWKGPTKGKVSDPSTYRGLQVGSTLCKILMMLIINRLKVWYDKQLLDQQQGFRCERGTTDGIFITKSIQQITNKMKKTTYLLFVDLTAAFDHVERSWLFKTIRKRFKSSCDKTNIQLIECLYKCTTASLAETPDDKFELNVGVRQGGVESPMLYNLFMDFVMRVFMDNCEKLNIKFLKLRYRIPESASSTGRVSSGTMTIDWSGYADDLVLTFEDERSLAKGICLLNETFKNYRLRINATKTKTMILNQKYEERAYPKTICSLEGEEIENVESYRYLGCEIKHDEPNTGQTELNLRADVAECKFYSLSRNLFNMNINLKIRTKMLNSLVRSRMLYSCQTWSCTKTQMTHLNAVYLSLLRKMVKGGFRRKDESWAYVFTNKDLLRMAKTEDIHSFVNEQRTNFVNKIVRKNNSSILKRLLFNDDDAKKRGPQTNLLSSVMIATNRTPEQFFKNATGQ